MEKRKPTEKDFEVWKKSFFVPKKAGRCIDCGCLVAMEQINKDDFVEIDDFAPPLWCPDCKRKKENEEAKP